METVFGADRVTYAQGAPFVAELPVAVPRTAFPGGLTASFYNSADFSGPVVATRTVKEIDTNWARIDPAPGVDRKTFSVRWRSEEHTSELQSLMRISYAVFCLKKKIKT